MGIATDLWKNFLQKRERHRPVSLPDMIYCTGGCGSRIHLYAALGTDVQHMAPACTQIRLYIGLETGQHIVGHKGLDGSGKAAAVNAAGSPPAQELLTQRQSKGQLLMVCVPGGGDVLQQHPGGPAGFSESHKREIATSPKFSVFFKKQ